MRKSKAIALTLLGLGSAGLAVGCGVQPAHTPPTDASLDLDDVELEEPAELTQVVFEPDDTWFDKDGNPIAKEWVEGPCGKRVPVQQPFDRVGRPWELDAEGNLVPPSPTTISSRPIIGGIAFLYVGGRGGTSGHFIPPPRGGVSAFKSGPGAMAGVSKGGFGSIGGRIATGGS